MYIVNNSLLTSRLANIYIADNAMALFEWAPVGTPVVVITEEKKKDAK